MRILSLTVGRNEEHRYLRSMLQHLSQTVDEMFFFDDYSSDATFEIASAAGAVTTTHYKEDGGGTFKADEGMFRMKAWRVFEEVMSPAEGDWVLVIDCDEVIVPCASAQVNTAKQLRQTIYDSECLAINLSIPEVFEIDDEGRPWVRVDRLWGTIHAPRLFAYQSTPGLWPMGKFGVPAVPRYVMSTAWGQTDRIALMHYGYAARDDQMVKYLRYSGNEGHSSEHVESIMAPDPLLVRWEAPWFEMKRSD